MNEHSAVSSKVKSVLVQCRDVHEAIELETAKIDQYQDQVRTKLDDYQKILSGVSVKLNKIRSLQQLIEYYKILRDIEDIK